MSRIGKMKWGSRLAVGAVGFLTTLGIAFFIGSYLGDGSHTGTAGSGGEGVKTLPIAVSFPDGQLTPGNTVEITAKVNNTTGAPRTFQHLTADASSTAPGCEDEWLKVEIHDPVEDTWGTEVNRALTYPVGESNVLPKSGSFQSYEVMMTESGTDQSACEGAPITVHMHLS